MRPLLHSRVRTVTKASGEVHGLTGSRDRPGKTLVPAAEGRLPSRPEGKGEQDPGGPRRSGVALLSSLPAQLLDRQRQPGSCGNLEPVRADEGPQEAPGPLLRIQLLPERLPQLAAVFVIAPRDPQEPVL